MAAFGGQIAAKDLNVRAAEMKTATGTKKVSPDRMTTIRQMQHYEDN